MSAAAASTAALDHSFKDFFDNSVGEAPAGRSRRRLRSVPAAAGPVPERVVGHPLSLGRNARARLGGAVRTLLGLAGLDGAPDAVRLAVLVLASRTPSETGVVEIRTSELGRWLGLSASYTASNVVPVLRRSGVVEVETAPGEYGQDAGLRCKVLPLWAAQDVVGHPLSLSKKEFATLLRLLEAVMAPGWVHRDGRVTSAGLIGTRTGRGAATDRLALLLLVLEARETGRVRLCGGVVDTKRGRAAATVARLLSCSASAGERVLERLEHRGLVHRPRLQTRSGLASRSRLVVPAVAAAHGNPVAAVREDRAEALESRFSDPDVAARPGEALKPETEPQVNSLPVTDEADVSDPDVAVDLHTDHSSLGTSVFPPAVSRGFSGEGRGGFGDLPDRACVREDRTVLDGTDVAKSAPPLAHGGPLRGEKPKESSGDEQGGQGAIGAGTGSRPKALGWEEARHRRRVGLPADLLLRVALGSVAGLWERLSGWQQDQVEAATKAELRRLAGMLKQPEAAPQLLADRLADRLEEVGGEALVRDPMGWVIGRGLVQRQSCADPRCDDGIRLDTRADCPTCTTVIANRRAQRARLRALVDEQLAGASTAERRAVYEKHLREHTHREAARAEVCRAREADAVQARRAVAARRRAQQEAAAQARRSAPCAECDLPDAAGLCPQCTHQQRIQDLLREAVDLAVAVRAGLDDPDDVAQLTEQCAADTQALLTKASQHNNSQPELQSLTEREVADRIRAERRTSALKRLLVSEEADAESETVYEMVLRRHPTAHQAAQEAAERARYRTAQYLLQQRLSQLHVLRIRAAAGRLPQRTP
ncbi:hypothetical protein [Streptomyces sp. NPDC051132]|uniref:hypothetical protein n=1 Tax=unclassified Streptomyces TaxID=2593676 RepID=UPI00344A586A